MPHRLNMNHLQAHDEIFIKERTSGSHPSSSSLSSTENIYSPQCPTRSTLIAQSNAHIHTVSLPHSSSPTGPTATGTPRSPTHSVPASISTPCTHSSASDPTTPITPTTTVASMSPAPTITPTSPHCITASADYLALEDEFIRLILAANHKEHKLKPTHSDPEIPLAPWPKDWPVYWEGAGLGPWYPGAA